MQLTGTLGINLLKKYSSNFGYLNQGFATTYFPSKKHYSSPVCIATFAKAVCLFIFSKILLERQFTSNRSISILLCKNVWY